MKKEFLEPQLDLITFEVEDVITASGNSDPTTNELAFVPVLTEN